MLSVLGIYVVALATAFAAGLAAFAILEPRRHWGGLAALPLGVGALLLLVYPLGYFLPTRIAGPLVLGALGVSLVVGAARRYRSRRGEALPVAFRRAMLPRGGDAALLCWGAVAGGMLLSPLLEMRRATTAAVSVFDGWARAVFTQWVYANPTSAAKPITPSERPLGSYSVPPPELAMGLEHLAAINMAVTGRDAHEVVAIVAAVAIPVGACGLGLIARALGANVTLLNAPLLAFAACVPTVAFLFADNYLTQLLSVGLVPFAAASAIYLGRDPRLRNMAFAAISCLAVIGVYPPMLPWLVPLVLTGIAIGASRRPESIRRATTACGLLALAVLVAGPLQLRRAYESVAVVSGLRSNEGFPLFPLRTQIEVALGGRSAFSSPPFSLPGEVVTGSLVAALVAAALLLGVFGARRKRDAAALGSLVVAAVVPTLALVWRYGIYDDYGYGVAKAIASGGTLICGLAIVALILPARRKIFVPRHVLAAVCCFLWLPVSLQTTSLIPDRGVGFRERDFEFHRALQAVPTGSTILFEGVSRDLLPYKTRAIAAFFISQEPSLTMLGQGTAPTYMTGGGSPDWRPDEAWDFVVSSERRMVESQRQITWSNDAYELSTAPPLDITPFGRGWTAAEDRGDGRSFAGLSGSAEFLVSNRWRGPQGFALSARLTNPANVSQSIMIGHQGRNRQVRVPPGGTTVLEVKGLVRGRAVEMISIATSDERAAVPALRVDEVAVRPLPEI